MDENATQVTQSTDANDSSAETQNTVSQEQQETNYVPQSRFSEVNSQLRKAQEELEKFKQAEAKRLEQERLALGKHEEVIAELRPQAEKAAQLESLIQTYLDRELETIPEEMRDIIPAGDAATRLDWVQKARQKGLFDPKTPRTAPNLDGGKGTRQNVPTNNATQEDIAWARKLNMPIEKYLERQAELESGANVNDDL